MKKILIIYLLCNQIFISCKSQSQQGEVVNLVINKAREYVQDSTKGNLIDLKTATSFKWDTLYKIGELVSDESIGNWIGIKDYKSLLHEGGTHEDYCRLIFIRDGQVVHEEEYNYMEQHEYEFNVWMPIDITSPIIGRDTNIASKHFMGCYLDSKPFVTASEAIFVMSFNKNWKQMHTHKNDVGYTKFFDFLLARDEKKCVYHSY